MAEYPECLSEDDQQGEKKHLYSDSVFYSGRIGAGHTQERSGMGFTFMEAFADEVKVKSVPGKGTTVKLIKIIGKGEECGENL